MLCDSFDDEDVEKIASILTCKVGKGEEGMVCYLVKEGEREKPIPVSDSLTLVLRSLYGNKTLAYSKSRPFTSLCSSFHGWMVHSKSCEGNPVLLS